MESDKAETASVDHSWKKTKHLELRGFHHSMCFLPKNVGNSKKQTICTAPLVLLCRALGESSLPTGAPWSKAEAYIAVLSLLGRILDLKTGTVKKEGQQSSMRMCMGSRRSFICRMRSVWTNGGLWPRLVYSLLTCR